MDQKRGSYKQTIKRQIINSKSFSLVELIVVVVIVSILSFSISSNKLSREDELETQLKTHFELLKMFALSDDKYEVDDTDYYKKRWQIIFAKSKYTNNNYTYTIFSDSSGNSSGNPDIVEIAKDPNNPYKLLSGGYSGILKTTDSRATKKMNIGKTYGVVDVKFEGGCRYYSSKRLAFDYMARPLKGNLSSYKRPYHHVMSKECQIYLCFDNDCKKYKKIVIQPYTGYVEVGGN